MRDTSVSIKTTVLEKKEIKSYAEKYQDGNVSLMLRKAWEHYRRLIKQRKKLWADRNLMS